MRTWGLLLTFILAPGLCSADFLSDALIGLKRGQKAESFKKLEKVFAQSSSPAEKTSAAILCATANPKFLKRKRRVYAEYAITHDPHLPPTDLQRLHRIVGDDSFSDADLSSAQKAYETALEIPGTPTEDLEYATYKLGWVYLNQKNPGRAWKLWTGWISSHPQGGLRSSIIKDAGKSYIEALFEAHVPIAAQELKLSQDADAQAFFDGLSIGIARQKSPDFSKIKSSLIASGYYTPLVARSLESGNLIVSNPCRALEWIRDAKISELPSQRVEAVLNACAEKQSAQGGKDWALIAQVYSSIGLTGTHRQGRAEAYRLAGRAAEACREYQTALRELIASKAVQGESFPRLIVTAQRRCQNGLSEDVIASLFSDSAVRSAIDPARRKTWLSAWSEVAKNPQTSRYMIRQLIAHSGIWQGTETAELILDEAPITEKEALLIVLVKPENLNEHSRNAYEQTVKRAIDSKEWGKARALLTRYTPLSPGTPAENLKFWNQLALQKQLSPAELAVFLDATLRNGSHLSAPEREGLLALWIEQKDWNQIFKNYTLIEKEIRHAPDIQDRLAKEYFERALIGQAPELTARDELTRYLKEIDIALATAETRAPAVLHAPRTLKSSPSYQDLSRYVLLKNLEREYAKVELKNGPRLAKDLERRIFKLKSSVEGATKKAWSYEPILSKADQVVIRITTEFADKIANIPIDSKEDKAELLALSETIRQWRLR